MKIKFLHTSDKKIKHIKEKIWQLICLADEEFYPPLSVRDSENVVFEDKQTFKPTGKPYIFFNEVMNQHIFAAFEKEVLVGFLSYESDYTNEDLEAYGYDETWYVNALIVDDNHRRKGIANKLYDALEQYAVSRTDDIFTRTWSFNHSHIKLVKNRGYELVIQLDHHRGKDVHTVYYRKKIEQ